MSHELIYGFSPQKKVVRLRNIIQKDLPHSRKIFRLLFNVAFFPTSSFFSSYLHLLPLPSTTNPPWTRFLGFAKRCGFGLQKEKLHVHVVIEGEDGDLTSFILQSIFFSPPSNPLLKLADFSSLKHETLHFFQRVWVYFFTPANINRMVSNKGSDQKSNTWWLNFGIRTTHRLEAYFCHLLSIPLLGLGF